MTGEKDDLSDLEHLIGPERDPWWTPPREGTFRGKPIIQPDFDKMEREISKQRRTDAEKRS